MRTHIRNSVERFPFQIRVYGVYILASTRSMIETCVCDTSVLTSV